MHVELEILEIDSGKLNSPMLANPEYKSRLLNLAMELCNLLTIGTWISSGVSQCWPPIPRAQNANLYAIAMMVLSHTFRNC